MVDVLEMIIGLSAFSLLVTLQLLATFFATYPTDFSWTFHGPLALGVALATVYGILVNAWVIWVPFAVQFTLSFFIILVKAIQHKRSYVGAW